jgi:serine/threonine-protein kinase
MGGVQVGETGAPSEAADPTLSFPPAGEMSGGVIHGAQAVQTARGLVVGTLGYMSPEQTLARSDKLDARSDVFSLGVILFEILTLEHYRPRQDAMKMIVTIRQETSTRPSDRTPHRDVPPELDEIFLRATQREPAARYQTARALHQDIERYLRGERDTALRREISAQHSKAAMVALEQVLAERSDAHAARRSALAEVGRALALDPGNRKALNVLKRLLGDPPRQVPPEVEAQIQIDLAARERLRLQSLGLTGAAAVIWLPLLLLMGIRNGPVMGLLALLSAANVGVRWWVSYPSTPIAWRYVAQLISLAMIFCVGRILGPLVLMTMPLTVHALLHSISGQAALRRFVLVTSCTLLIGMVGLEQLGWLRPTYHFLDGALVISPNLVSLPPTLTMLLLLSITLLYIVVPAVAIRRLPVHLAEAESRLAVHAWQLRNLFPEASSVVAGGEDPAPAPTRAVP